MSRKPISSDSGTTTAPDSADGGMDWVAFDALTDDEVEQSALADPDAQPMTAEQLRRARRVGLAGSIRLKLKLSREEFSAKYHVPIETVRGWERGTLPPDAISCAFLELIITDPEGVARVLALKGPALAAE